MNIKEAYNKGLLKVGVKIRRNYGNGCIYEGIIERFDAYNVYIRVTYVREGMVSVGGIKEIDLTNITEGIVEILSSNNNNMNLLEKFSTLLKGEPEKSFHKAGITNADDTLTEDGKTVFLSWLLKKHGDEFKTDVVDELLKEEKKD